MFGESIGLMDENGGESASTFHHALDYAQQGTIFRLRLGNLMFAHYDKKFRNSCKIVHSYAQKYVDQALRYRCTNNISLSSERKTSATLNKGEKVDHRQATFLEELAKETDDPTLLRDQIVNMLLAARDTTAGLLAFAFFTLARHPEEWEKTRANVLEHYCEPLTYEAVMRMTYLRYVLQESKSHDPFSSSIPSTLTIEQQPSASSHPSPPTAAWPKKTPSSPSAAAPMASPPSS